MPILRYPPPARLPAIGSRATYPPCSGSAAASASPLPANRKKYAAPAAASSATTPMSSSFFFPPPLASSSSGVSAFFLSAIGAFLGVAGVQAGEQFVGLGGGGRLDTHVDPAASAA